MIDLIFILIAGVCKAITDTLDQHFDVSVFRDKPRKFWDPNIVHKTGPKIFGYPIDAWHIVNSIQVCCWLAIPFIYKPFFQSHEWYLDYCLRGLAFVIVFNIFYNKIFKK